jgi:hypothetical protein
MTTGFQPNAFQPDSFQQEGGLTAPVFSITAFQGMQQDAFQASVDSNATATGGTSYSLQLLPGVYAYSGAALASQIARYFLAAPGAYAYSGSAIAFIRDVKFPLSSGAYAYSGAPLSFQTGRYLQINSGSYAYTGSLLTGTLARYFSIAPGAYSYIGAPANLVYTPGTGAVAYTLTLLPGAYNYSGAPMDFSAPVPVVPVVRQGGHGAAYYDEDEELERIRNDQVRKILAAKKRRRKLEEAIAETEQVIEELAEEKQQVVVEAKQEVQLYKAEFKQVLPEAKFQDNLEALRKDYRRQKVVIAKKEKQQKEQLGYLQKQLEGIQLQETRDRIAEQKAAAETAQLMARLRRRRGEEEILMLLDLV